MRKNLLTTLFSVGLAFFVNAQSVDPFVIASAGDFYSNASGMIQWTDGEVMTETFSTANNFVTQGFQQPEDFTTAIAVQNETGVTLFPNPASDHVTIEFGSDANGEYSVEVFNSLGEQMTAQHCIVANGISRFDIGMNNFANGIYFVKIKKAGTNSVSTFKVSKVY
ncbi:MAG: T9SS type A sorting domain-containing protein [Bacteroidetes bacterium]|nr:T9SS type A sorting domain-containing protein [Bacteroidota bacterium]